MRQRPLNKSNKIDVIHFSKLNDNLGNFPPTNGMRKRHNLRLRVTHSRAYGIVKNDNFLKCAINLLNCSRHLQDYGCLRFVLLAPRVSSYNLKSQITAGPPGLRKWDFRGGSGKQSRRGQVGGSLRPPIHPSCSWDGARMGKRVWGRRRGVGVVCE